MNEGAPWTDEENDRLVEAYFDLLARDIARRAAGEDARSLNKMAIYRSFGGRNVKSVEAKMQNVSAILEECGAPTVSGLKGRSNYQHSLADAISRATHRFDDIPFMDIRQPELKIVDAPIFRSSNQETPDFIKQLIRKVDPAVRDERNRKLGFAGEEMIFNLERRRIESILPRRVDDVRWVARDEGDGHGYDIRSFDEHGEELFIEVKTTRGGQRTPFFMTANEKRVADERSENYRICRIFEFDREPKMFSLAPPLERSVDLRPHAFIARFL